MSFFKDFKADLSQAVNELLPDETGSAQDVMAEEPQMVDTITDNGGYQEDISDILEKLDQASQNTQENGSLFADESETVQPIPEPVPEPLPIPEPLPVPEPAPVPVAEPAPAPMPSEVVYTEAVSEPAAPAPAPAPVEQPVQRPVEPAPVMQSQPAPEPVVQTQPVPEPEVAVVQPVEEKIPVAPVFSQEVKRSAPINTTMEDFSMETAIITAGMAIKGDVNSDGSLDLSGSVTGNINIKGKLEVTGAIEGNSFAEEVFADGAQITGEIHSNGSVKIGEGTVVKGNISATSAVLAGAVKGDIDVQGPVILDSTAIIMGNIKSKSIQINNGAVIEGLCSQCYADVSPMSFFGEDKKSKS